MPDSNDIIQAGRCSVIVRIRLTTQQRELLEKLKADPRFPKGAQDGDIIHLVFQEWLREHELV